MKLDDYLRIKKISNPSFARDVGRDRTTIMRLREGRQRPSYDLMVRIAQATDNQVLPNDFFDFHRASMMEAAQ